MSNETWPTIRKRVRKVNGQTYTYWVVDAGTAESKGRFQNFTSLKKAEREAARLRIERKKLGADAIRLRDPQKREAVEALRHLEDRGTLVEAAQFFVSHTTLGGGMRRVEDVFKEYLDSKQKANKRPLSIRDARQKLQRFVAVFGKVFLHEVTVHDIEGWLDSLNATPVTREAYMRNVRAFFEFGVRREYVKVNVARKVEKATLDDHIPSMMPAKGVETLLRKAETETPRLVPYLALAFFAGLRPTSEIGEMTWDNIDLEGRVIRVIPSVAKTRRQRFVDISDNLAAWLESYRNEGKIHSSRNEFDRVRKLAGVAWDNDIARHTFGSCYLAKHQDIQKTCLQMGHTSPDMLFTHYRGLCKKEDAEAFWKIMPQKPAQSEAGKSESSTREVVTRTGAHRTVVLQKDA